MSKQLDPTLKQITRYVLSRDDIQRLVIYPSGCIDIDIDDTTSIRFTISEWCLRKSIKMDLLYFDGDEFMKLYQTSFSGVRDMKKLVRRQVLKNIFYAAKNEDSEALKKVISKMFYSI